MLFLNDAVVKLHLVTEKAAEALKHLGIATIRDLLAYYPRDWQDLSDIKTVSQVKPNEKINLKVKIKKFSQHRSPYRRMHLTQALLEDHTGNILAVWFNQPFLKNVLKEGKEYYMSGKTQVYETLQLQNPTFELVKTDTIHTAGIVPVYELTEGLTLKQIRYFLKQALICLPQFQDAIPPALQKKLKLVSCQEALKNLHFPKNATFLEEAKKRLAFEELFLFQLALLSFKKKIKTLPALPIPFEKKLVQDFVKNLPFKLTAAQRLAAWEILRDLSRPHPMNRLLEGEVGSGKTVVAGLAMLEVAHAGYQSVLLAPTEILAWQHYETLKNLFQNSDLEIALLTRSHKTFVNSVIARQEVTKQSQGIRDRFANARDDNILLNKISAGQIKIIIGTHALLQEHVKFQKIGLLVVDEQHRFGVSQRAKLAGHGSSQMNKQINADKRLLYEDITYKIRAALFNVYNTLGPGHKENIYHKALIEELRNQQLKFDTEKNIAIEYLGKKVGDYKPDFIIENKILLEIKALPFLGQLEKKQIWSCLKGSNFKLALLVNFGSRELEIKRIIYDKDYQLSSVPYPGESVLEVPHLLSMTATPIPRTLALAFYGDLDISELKELPRGRKKVITRLVEPDKRAVVYEWIRKHLTTGRQMYVVTPLIGEMEITKANSPPSPLFGKEGQGEFSIKAAVIELENLKKIFPEFTIGLLHGQLKGEEKKRVMEDFKVGKIQTLVSTSVIEVGVDVPNAAIMIIENAERFGLSQLHQLRGRVGRSDLQSYCLLFAGTANEFTRKRLEAVVNSNDGFELAEKDLELRGPGEIMGTRQSGYIPLKIAKLTDRKTLNLARIEAERLLMEDAKLTKYPALRGRVETLAKDAHLE